MYDSPQSGQTPVPNPRLISRTKIFTAQNRGFQTPGGRNQKNDTWHVISLPSGIALALTIMNNGCTEYQMPWWRGLRRIWSWRRRTVASPVSGDHDPITGEPYYRMLPTDDGGESYEMECLLCKAQGNILASRFIHEENCPLRPTGK